ncbi:MAG: hypothetical protein CMP59_01525 [Flavobacteriales bacterium]|nr:hypothetical protein [Flavobacteriales bacterium]|tara:strand:- start:258 stop:635 length:378 start_codon:yes stop_codon:yes gene_type:complete
MRSVLLSLCICLGISLNAQENSNLATLFANGDAKGIAAFFNNSVEMNLPDHNGIYQKEQATMLLKNFFAANPPVSFEVKHEGGSKRKSSFQIGKLKCKKAEYRTYLIYNSVDGTIQIIELRIEEE